jgi:hypothetical protein
MLLCVSASASVCLSVPVPVYLCVSLSVPLPLSLPACVSRTLEAQKMTTTLAMSAATWIMSREAGMPLQGERGEEEGGCGWSATEAEIGGLVGR